MHFVTLPSIPVHGAGLLIALVLTIALPHPVAAAESAAVPVDDLEEWLGADDAPEGISQESIGTSWRWRINTGLEYSEGDFGIAEKADAWVQSLSLRLGKGDWAFGVDGSYQWVSGPALNPLIFDDLSLFFEEYLETGSLFVQEKHDGFGDLRFSARYAPVEDLFDGWYPSMSIKVKVPVAADAFTTGKTDVTVSGDLTKVFGDLSVFTLASHTVRGGSVATGGRNTFAGSFGTDYRLGPAWGVGVSYDVRETRTVGGGLTSSVFGYGRYRINDRVSLLGYGSAGLDNKGPDTTVGLRMSIKGLW